VDVAFHKAGKDNAPCQFDDPYSRKWLKGRADGGETSVLDKEVLRRAFGSNLALRNSAVESSIIVSILFSLRPHPPSLRGEMGCPRFVLFSYRDNQSVPSEPFCFQ
jgi:hypothetical protein